MKELVHHERTRHELERLRDEVAALRPEADESVLEGHVRIWEVNETSDGPVIAATVESAGERWIVEQVERQPKTDEWWYRLTGWKDLGER